MVRETVHQELNIRNEVDRSIATIVLVRQLPFVLVVIKNRGEA